MSPNHLLALRVLLDAKQAVAQQGICPWRRGFAPAPNPEFQSLVSGPVFLSWLLEGFASKKVLDVRDGFPDAAPGRFFGCLGDAQLLLPRVAKPSVRGDAPASGGSGEALGRVLGGSREALGRFWEEKRNKKTLPNQHFFSFPLLFLPYISK